MEMLARHTVAFATLGCKLNFAETSTIAKSFAAAGYRRVSVNSPADVYVVNTCSVTEHSDKKCRNLIRKLHKLSPHALIGVTGCYAQLKPREVLQIEGVTALFGTATEVRFSRLFTVCCWSRLRSRIWNRSISRGINFP